MISPSPVHSAVLQAIDLALRNSGRSLPANPQDGDRLSDGLGLDSIDMLEISLVISKHYGFQLRSDNKNNEKIYASLRSLCNYIASQRTL